MKTMVQKFKKHIKIAKTSVTALHLAAPCRGSKGSVEGASPLRTYPDAEIPVNFRAVASPKSGKPASSHVSPPSLGQLMPAHQMPKSNENS